MTYVVQIIFLLNNVSEARLSVWGKHLCELFQWYSWTFWTGNNYQDNKNPEMFCDTGYSFIL